jgi:hypothetical protein
MDTCQSTSTLSIYSIIELQPFWKSLRNGGYVFVCQIPRSVDKLLQIMNGTSAKQVLDILQTILEVLTCSVISKLLKTILVKNTLS